MLLYLLPGIGSAPALIVSVKVYKDTEIAGLSDQKKQEQVDAHIFMDQFSKHDNDSKRGEQYLQREITPAFPVV